MAKSNEPRNEVQTHDPRTENTPVVQRVSPAVLQTGRPDSLSTGQLRSVQSFDDAMRIAAEQHGDVEDYAEKYGSGFAVVDKDVFVNKSIVLLEWRFSNGDFGDFVSAAVYGKDGSKGIINDGSTGIRDQLYAISFEEGKFGSLLVRKGLRKSEYGICPGLSDAPCGKPRPADETVCSFCGSDSTSRGVGATFYLDQSPS